MVVMAMVVRARTLVRFFFMSVVLVCRFDSLEIARIDMPAAFLRIVENLAATNGLIAAFLEHQVEWQPLRSA